MQTNPASKRTYIYKEGTATILDPSHLLASPFVPFVAKDINKRTNPQAILPGAQSVYVFAMEATPILQPLPQGENLVELSTLGTTIDYHHSLRTLMEDFAKDLEGQHKILVDSPTLDERAYALHTGLGFFGRHGLIITPQFGTRFNIGLILSTLPTTARASTIGQCPPHCNKCIQACPTGALQQGKPLNTGRCASYLTQKKHITPEEGALIKQSNQVYGCEICQDACPFNKPRAKTFINPSHWGNQTNHELELKYKSTAMLWQGTEILRRNCKIFAPHLDSEAN